MDATHAAALVAAGLAAGLVNAVAGGGSLITFPTLVGIGLPLVPANVTNSVAVSPGYLASVVGSRRDLAALATSPRSGAGRGWLARLVPTTVVGAVAGCVLLRTTPERLFELVVPVLVLAATAVLAGQQRLRRLVGHPRELSPRRRTVTLHAIVGLGGVYGGYFGAALGIMLVAGLGLVLDETLARVTALKNAISAMVGLVTVVAFVLLGGINWAAVAVLAPATLVGGYVGARIAGRLPGPVLRAVVVTVGLVVGLVLLIRAVRTG